MFKVASRKPVATANTWCPTPPVTTSTRKESRHEHQPSPRTAIAVEPSSRRRHGASSASSPSRRATATSPTCCSGSRSARSGSACSSRSPPSRSACSSSPCSAFRCCSATWYAVRAFANVERGVASALLERARRPAPMAPGVSGNLWVRLRDMSRDRARWRELGYLMLRFPAGIATFTLAVTALTVPVIDRLHADLRPRRRRVVRRLVLEQRTAGLRQRQPVVVDTAAAGLAAARSRPSTPSTRWRVRADVGRRRGWAATAEPTRSRRPHQSGGRKP